MNSYLRHSTLDITVSQFLGTALQKFELNASRIIIRTLANSQQQKLLAITIQMILME